MDRESELDAQRNLPKRNRLMVIVQLSPLLPPVEANKRKQEIVESIDRLADEKGWNAENGHRGAIATKWTKPRLEGAGEDISTAGTTPSGRLDELRSGRDADGVEGRAYSARFGEPSDV